MNYDHQVIEKRWKEFHLKNNTYYCDVYDFSRPKYYVLDMFPYPSGQGLHVGHPLGYTATDVISRMKRMQGYNVLHPMGWDAFGLPAEQYAIKNNVAPEDFTRKNIAHFKDQLNSIGLSYDWSKEIATIDADYYKWTQWIFLQLYKNGLAYVDYVPVNFCPELGTVLANEEVIDGKSERGGFPVIKKPMRQWVLRITAYAEKLLDGLTDLDWPKSTREMQVNWIGKSAGVEIEFAILNHQETFKVFTTRVDTLFGCTYCCLAPEHPLIAKVVSKEQKPLVDAYIETTKQKSDLERTELNKDKTGVFLGAYAINPINGRQVPIYVADYVLFGYGEGAVMAVPAHDDRDYAFAKKHHLPMIQVLNGDISSAAMTHDAKHINSEYANGMNIAEASKVITDHLITLGKGQKKINYKLRDWLFSRQRYWGEPIPIIKLEDGTLIPLKEEELPLVLPLIDNYKPSSDGQSPLANAKEWVNVTVNGIKGTRETNTMPQWAGSCWYYIRYLDPHNDKVFADKKLIDHWLPVDLYVGGAEHAVLHLLYARFWHKFLFDQGYVGCPEPFQKLFHQGLVLGENREKMSKSRGNVINPDEIIAAYGADALRLFLMFSGPLEESFPWSTTGLIGARRFIERVYRLYKEEQNVKKFSDTNDGQLDYEYNYLVKKVTNDFASLQINTAIAQMMIFINACYKLDKLYRPYMLDFLKMFSCVCPFLGEELYYGLTGELVDYQPWMQYDESKITKDEVNIAISVNGKLRATIKVPLNSDQEFVQKAALSIPQVIKYVENKSFKKVIFVKNKILNIVI